MRKTKGITKYNLRWQLCRVAARQEAHFTDKVWVGTSILDEHRSYANWERVVNWLEGLERGYRKRNDFAIDYINDKIAELEAIKDQFDEYDDDITMTTVSSRQLRRLYGDLRGRGRVWLKGGYVHAEHEAFIDKVVAELAGRGIDCKHGKYIEMRDHARTMVQTHNFFF